MKVPISDLQRDSFDIRPTEVFRKIVEPSYNTLQAIRTTIGTSPTLIDFPEGSSLIYLKHAATGVTIWVGSERNITANGTEVFPIDAGEVYQLHLKRGNSNNIYAVVASGSEYIYAMGAFNS